LPVRPAAQPNFRLPEAPSCLPDLFLSTLHSGNEPPLLDLLVRRCLRQLGQNFLSSNRSLMVFLFLATCSCAACTPVHCGVMIRRAHFIPESPFTRAGAYRPPALADGGTAAPCPWPPA